MVHRVLQRVNAELTRRGSTARLVYLTSVNNVIARIAGTFADGEALRWALPKRFAEVLQTHLELGRSFKQEIDGLIGVVGHEDAPGAGVVSILRDVEIKASLSLVPKDVPKNLLKLFCLHYLKAFVRTQQVVVDHSGGDGGGAGSGSYTLDHRSFDHIAPLGADGIFFPAALYLVQNSTPGSFPLSVTAHFSLTSIPPFPPPSLAPAFTRPSHSHMLNPTGLQIKLWVIFARPPNAASCVYSRHVAARAALPPDGQSACDHDAGIRRALVRRVRGAA